MHNRQSLLCTGCLYTNGNAYWDSLNLEKQTKLLLQIFKKDTIKEVAIQLVCPNDQKGEELKFCKECDTKTQHWIMFGEECIPCSHKAELHALMRRPAQERIDMLFDKTHKELMAPYIKVGIANKEVIEKFSMKPTQEYVDLYKGSGIYDHL